MNKVSPETVSPTRQRRTGRKWIAAAITIALAVIGWTTFGRDQWLAREHHSQRLRIALHFDRAMAAIAPDKRYDLPPRERGRYEIIRAIHASLVNWPFYYRRNTVPAKVKALADRLDANGGADLTTFEGGVELLLLADEASKAFYDYPFVTALYELAVEGAVPKLPVLGERWKQSSSGKP